MAGSLGVGERIRGGLALTGRRDGCHGTERRLSFRFLRLGLDVGRGGRVGWGSGCRGKVGVRVGGVEVESGRRGGGRREAVQEDREIII